MQTTQVSRHRSKNTATALQMAVTGVSHILPFTAHCPWHNDASRCRQHSTEASSAGRALCAGSDNERHSALFAGVKGGKAIDEIAARKGRFEWGAFLTAAVEAPPAETGGAAAAADNCGAQVRSASPQTVLSEVLIALPPSLSLSAPSHVSSPSCHLHVQARLTAPTVRSRPHVARQHDLASIMQTSILRGGYQALVVEDAPAPTVGAVTSAGLAAATQAALQGVRRTRRRCGPAHPDSASLVHCLAILA